MIKINEVTKDGYYIGDQVFSDNLPQYWTSDLVDGGYYAAQYQNASINPETGELTSGNWVETGGPSEKMITFCNTQIKLENIEEATKAIAPLQDAVDLEIATDAETTLLKAWKTYRVQLNRIDTSVAADVTWPEKPA